MPVIRRNLDRQNFEVVQGHGQGDNRIAALISRKNKERVGNKEREGCKNLSRNFLTSTTDNQRRDATLFSFRNVCQFYVQGEPANGEKISLFSAMHT